MGIKKRDYSEGMGAVSNKRHAKAGKKIFLEKRGVRGEIKKLKDGLSLHQNIDGRLLEEKKRGVSPRKALARKTSLSRKEEKNKEVISARKKNKDASQHQRRIYDFGVEKKRRRPGEEGSSK